MLEIMITFKKEKNPTPSRKNPTPSRKN